jgi:hypothetical protein
VVVVVQVLLTKGLLESYCVQYLAGVGEKGGFEILKSLY